MDIHEMENAMVQVIGAAIQRLDGKTKGDEKWTETIFTALTEYAYGQKLWVWTKKNKIDATLTGCLYDFMICEGQTANDIERVWVAMECEWKVDFNEIKYDFYKLVIGRSMLRVMIFQSRDVDGTIRKLIDIVEKSSISLPGDRYLLAGWNDDNGVEFRRHTKI